jgi:CheY-like chemotaxis protein
MKFLIVDDSNAFAYMTQKILESLGHEWERAKHGREAVDKLLNGSYDFILLDSHMPVMSGMEFLRYNWENHITETPIIMLSTVTQNEYIQDAYHYGVEDYLLKPINKEIILSKIQKLPKAA